MVIATISVAPLETSDRCEALSPNAIRLSNTHCIVRPGNPAKTSCMTGRSYQRFTVTIGIAAMPAAASSTACSSRGGEAPKSPRRPNQGTAAITGARGEPLAAHLDACHSPAADVYARQRRRPDFATAGDDEIARRLGIHLVQRAERQDDGRCRRIRREHVGEDAHECVGCRVAGLLIQGGDGERMPQPLLERRTLAVTIEPLLHREPWRIDGDRL